MRPLLAALLLLLPAAGAAQTLTLTVNGAGTNGVLAYNAVGCSYLVAGGWVGTNLTAACTSLQIWVTASTCGTAPSTTNSPADVVVYTAQAGDLANGKTSDSFSFAFNTLPSFTTNPCGAVVDFTNTLCAAVTTKATDNSCTGTVAQATAVSLRYDNVPPQPPLVNIVPLDSQLSVRLAPSDTSDTISYFSVQYALEPPDGGTPNNYITVGGNVAANNPVVTISGLVNGTNYLVQGVSIDEATNRSAPSAAIVATPVVTYGFYANYIGAGGDPAGGCGDAAGGGPSALALVSVLMLGLARRRG